MKLLLVTGGARAGKSSYAQERAQREGGDAVTYVATARSIDDEMAQRIERHQRDRPAGWITVEAPLGVSETILTCTTEVILLDCITTLVANTLEHAQPRSLSEATDAIVSEAEAITSVLHKRSGLLIAVTNEVGMSVHATTPLGRWYQDGLGHANQQLARAAYEVVLLVAGLPLVLKSPAPSNP